MKYYKGKIKSFYEAKRIASDAEGEKIPNAEYYFNKLRDGVITVNAPIFDYFNLKSFDDEQYWEWQLCDVHQFIGEGSQIYGWFVSDKLKRLFEKFHVAKDYSFYESKLLYRKEKLKYWIFQYAGKHKALNKSNYIDFKSSEFFMSDSADSIPIMDYNDFIKKSIEVYDEYGKDINFKKITLSEKVDFIPLNSMSSDKLFSERLKQAIEDNGITGFDFSEVDYEVVVE